MEGGISMEDYPHWICRDCGFKHQPDKDKIFMISTYHEGSKCGWCGEEKPTTEPRDFGFPEYKKESK